MYVSDIVTVLFLAATMVVVTSVIKLFRMDTLELSSKTKPPPESVNDELEKLKFPPPEYKINEEMMKLKNKIARYTG